MKLVEKLCEIMETVTYIQKRGKNAFHGYKYATEADVSDAIRKELAARHVFMLPSLESTVQREVRTKKGAVETVTKVRIVYTFLNGDDENDKLEMTMEGEGQDPGDKGIYKAITGATKYALMKAFLIPTGDDLERDEGVDERSADKEPLTEEDPFKDGKLPNHTGKLPPAGTKGINDARAITGHALKLGWTEEQLAEWVEKRTGGTLEDIKAAQAKALLQAIKQEKEAIDV